MLHVASWALPMPCLMLEKKGQKEGMLFFFFKKKKEVGIMKNWLKMEDKEIIRVTKNVL